MAEPKSLYSGPSTNTLKTVLTTTSVLFLGVTLLGMGTVVWVEQQEIQALQIQMSGSQTDITRAQEQTDSNTARLNRTIQTSNKNFSRLEKREDKMAEVVAAVCKLVLSETGQEPSSYKNPNSSGE